MGRFVGFANCKNCSKGFRKKALGSTYCSDHCRNEFNARKSSNKKSNVEESVWTLVESGARSIDVIAERLNISVAAVARIVGPGSEDLQEWRENHICEKCGKIMEFVDFEIEKLQEKVANQYKFSLKRHIHHLFGICKECH